MNIALWVVQGLLAAMFLMAGAMKLSKPKKELIAGPMESLEKLPEGAIKALGAVEVAGAIGLILPLALGIAPILTPLAAVGFIIVMIGALFTHIPRGELVPNGVVNIVILLLAAYVVVGRFVLVPVI